MEILNVFITMFLHHYGGRLKTAAETEATKRTDCKRK